MKFGYGFGFCEAALGILKLVSIFLSVRGPDRESVFDNRSDIGTESEFQVSSHHVRGTYKNKSGLSRGFLGSEENIVRKGVKIIKPSPRSRFLSGN